MPYQYNDYIDRQCIYLVGASGSGKSFWISEYSKQFKKLYPKSPVYFISAKNINDEKDIKTIKGIKQINTTDEEYLQELCENNNPSELFSYKNGLEPSLVIFDDSINGISIKKSKYISQIMTSILEVGRSKKIYCLIAVHSANKGKESKIMLQEMNGCVIFNNGVTKHSKNYLLEKYLGFDSRLINKIINTRSRWTFINKIVPMYIVNDNSLYFINN